MLKKVSVLFKNIKLTGIYDTVSRKMSQKKFKVPLLCIFENELSCTWLISPLLGNLHLADAFIQSDLQCISGYTFVLSVCVFPGNQTHNLCAANAML